MLSRNKIMNNNRLINFIYKLLFFIIASIHLIKYESEIVVSSNYCYYPDIITNEQVVDSSPVFTWDSPQNSRVFKNFTPEQNPFYLNNFFINPALVLNPELYPASQALEIEIINTPHHHIVSILLQKNIPHQDWSFPLFC